MELKVFNDLLEVSRAAAQHFVEQNRKAVAQTNGCVVALSGGSTPKLLYQLLADPTEPFRQQIDWDRTLFFFTDERNVPPNHPDSNFRMVWEAMFAYAPRTDIYRIAGEKHAAEAAKEYEAALWEFYGPHDPDPDIVLLGLGEEGHTASLFPYSSALKETERLVVAPWVEKLNSYRITMTLPILNNGHSVMFLVSGDSKAEILRQVIKEEADSDRYPAQAIRPVNGELNWFVDAAAARLIT